MFNNYFLSKTSNSKQKSNNMDYKTIVNLLTILISENKYIEANTIKEIAKEKYSGDPIFIAMTSEIELHLKDEQPQQSIDNCSAKYFIRSKL